MNLFDEGEATIVDRALDPVRKAATRSLVLAHAVKRRAMMEQDALLGALAIPDPPENLKKAAAWIGIALTVGALVLHVHKASKKSRRRG